MWKFHGQKRPGFAIEPGPGQESVWDYPRPPVAKPSTRTVEVWFGDARLCRSSAAIRVLETASPPTWYLPPEDIDLRALEVVPGSSFCEWKGAATYWGLRADPERGAVGWSYDDPSERFHSLAGYLAFYPGRIDCFVDGERVRPQPGSFYGGWMTDDIVGPVKGEAGTGGW
ncbi:MAG: DUF427 domain-containing protein [Gemmatimonadota bacterium]